MKRLLLITVLIITALSVRLTVDNKRLITERQDAISIQQLLTEKVKSVIDDNRKLVSKNQESVLENKEAASTNRLLVIKNYGLLAKSQYLKADNRMLIKQLAAKNQFENCFNATCRIRAREDRGTGCVFKVTKDAIFVITNAHVVGDYKIIYCEFWRDGHLLKPIKGKVVIKSTKVKDTAVIAISKSDLPKDFKIAVVPLAPPNYLLKKGQTIASVGCVQGNWPSLFKGHFIRYEKNNILFLPKPEGGRSGSAIFDAKGKMIVGLLWGVSNTGHAKSLQTIYPIVIPLEKSKLETKLYYFTSSTCTICQKQTPIIKRLIKEDYNFKIINNYQGINITVPTIIIGNQKIIGFHSYSDLKELLDG